MYAPLLDIIAAIGLPAAMKLVENFGGRRLYLPLPENIDETNGIAQAIGVEAARKLSEAWGRDRDQRPTIPRARGHLRVIVKGDILRDRKTLTIPQLAAKYEMTERNIYRYLSEIDEPEAEQPGLF